MTAVDFDEVLGIITVLAGVLDIPSRMDYALNSSSNDKRGCTS